MKNKIKTLVTCLLLLATACSEENNFVKSNEVLQASNLILEKENKFENLFSFPIGTVLWIESNELHFKLPEGYLLILKGVNYDKDISNVTSTVLGSVRCKCTEGTNCSPFIVGDKSGCTTGKDSCKECEMALVGELEGSETHSKQFDFIDAEVVDLNEPIMFLTDAPDIYAAKSPKGFIFDVPKVQNELIYFFKGYNSPEDNLILSRKDLEVLPAGYKYTPISFLGKLVFVPLNYNNSISAKLAEITISETTSCTCHKGTGCKLGKTWTPSGTIRYCDAGDCSDCELSKK